MKLLQSILFGILIILAPIRIFGFNDCRETIKLPIGIFSQNSTIKIYSIPKNIGDTKSCATTDAGTMTSVAPISLCGNECTDMLTHNGDEVLDGDDALEFIVHSGGNPATILARNDTPNFCFSNISGGQYGVTYYISAIAGNDLGGGFVNQSDPCYSQSFGTPVVWFENPIAFISETEISACGLESTLTAAVPPLGMTGTWSSSGVFFPVGSTINDNEINIIANGYGDQTLTWTINNGGCIATDEILVHFIQIPTAYAGEDYTICGNVAALEAIPSVTGSTGSWSGNGSFISASNPATSVTGGSFGQITFTWRENVGICWTEDQVDITFIQEPNPTTTSSYDTVCGNTANIQVFNVIGNGTWAAFFEGNPLGSAIYESGINSSQTNVTIGNYPTNELSRTVEFIWTETTQSSGVTCTNTATTFVTFSREPVASVGAVNNAEICSNCFTFTADTTGSGWAFGSWISAGIIATFDDNTLPNAQVCIDPLGSFGDSAYVETNFIWAMRNTGCTTLDTMWVSFFKQPTANAGLDNAICGRDYDLGAVYDFTENSNYTPSGSWSTFSKPFPTSATDIQPQISDTAHVTVSDHGIYRFVFRENNTNLTSCYSTDTVQIEFVQIPIISAGEDQDVCGQQTQMEGISAGFNGTWIPNGIYFVD
jgi:hypothetical protein